MTETAGGCVYDGLPLGGVRVRMDADGRVVIGGPTLAAGYLDDPVATGAAFVEHDDGRAFRTGDLGRWMDGRLEVLGRVDDVIVTGGEKVAPAAVERVLTAQPGVRAACVVGLPDPEWGAVVAAVLVVDAPPAMDGLRAAVRAVLGRAAVPRVLRTVDALPLRGIGKPDRAAVARLLAATAGRGCADVHAAGGGHDGLTGRANRRPTRRGDPESTRSGTAHSPYLHDSRGCDVLPGTDRRPGEQATMRMARGAAAALAGALVVATAVVGASAANAAQPGHGQLVAAAGR